MFQIGQYITSEACFLVQHSYVNAMTQAKQPSLTADYLHHRLVEVMFSPVFVSLFVSGITQKVMAGFSRN